MSEIILSIDIGKKNLGYTIYSPGIIFKFGLFNTADKIKKNKLKDNMESRNIVLLSWLQHIVEKYEITTIVVEKQVIRNVVAMCIQSCIISYALMSDISYITFDPKRKFTFTGATYNSHKKEHKKIVVRYAINTIEMINSKKLERFNKFNKKDDISDSIVMALMSHPETNLNEYRKVITSK